MAGVWIVRRQALVPLLPPRLIGGRIVRFLLWAIAAVLKSRVLPIVENFCLWQHVPQCINSHFCAERSVLTGLR